MRIERSTPKWLHPSARAQGTASSEGFAGLLGEQEAPAPPMPQPMAALDQTPLPPPVAAAGPARDREASRHGRAMLDALGGLQLAALGGGGSAVRQALTDLAQVAPTADDPRLEGILRAIAQRAAIELARAG